MTQVLIIGCGKMGGAILKGLLAKNLPWEFHVIDHHIENVAPYLDHKNVSFAENLDAENHADVILLGVKPQAMDSVLMELAQKNFQDALIISIAAGKTLAYFRKALPNQAALIRSMPNLPASIGVGVTAAVADKTLSEAQHEIAEHLLNAAGQLVWLDDESQMDAVTALSGSGPAYLFHLCEVMASAGKVLGLSEEISQELARQTIVGSALLLKNSDKTAEELRVDVTSPGGTTEAALSVLMHDDMMKALFEKALKAAQKKSQELS